VNKVTVL